MAAAKKVSYSVFIDGQAAKGTLRDLYAEKRKIQNALKDMQIGSKEYVKATEQFKKIDGQLKDHRANLGKVSKSQGELVQQTGLFGREIALLQRGMGGLKAGVALLTGAFHTLKGAIVATGIGALVVLIGSLFAWLTKTKRGAEFMERATAALGAAFAVITDRLSSVVDWLIKAFEDPKKSIKELGEFIWNNIINRFTAIIDIGQSVGKVLQGIWERDLDKIKEGSIEAGQALIQMQTGLDPEQQKKIADGIRGVANEIAEEATAAYDLTAALQTLKDQERELRVETAKRRLELRELKLIAEDETKSIREREQAIQAAFAIEQELQAKQLAAAQERVRITREQIDLGESLEEDYDKLADAEVALYEEQAKSVKLQTTLQTKLNTLKNQAAAEANKAAAAAKKEAEAIRKEQEKLDEFIEKKREELRVAKLAEDEQELANISAKYDEMIAQAQGYDERLKEIEAIRDEELALKKEEQKAADDEEKAAALEKRREFEESLTAMSLEGMDAEIYKAEEKYAELIRQAEEFGIDTAMIEQQRLDALDKIRDDYSKKDIERAQREKAQKIAAYAATATAAADIVTAISQFVGEDTVAGAQLAKTAALIQIGADTAKAIASAVAASAANPANAVTGGAAGIAQFATMSATILMNIARAKALLETPPPKPQTVEAPNIRAYAEGGSTRDASGFTGNGARVYVAGEAGEEWISPNWQVKSPLYADTLGYLEFARQNDIGRYAEGGSTARQPSGGAMMDTEKLTQAINMLTGRLMKPIKAEYGDSEIRNISRAQDEQAQIRLENTI